MTAAEQPRDLLAALQASITRASEMPATVTAAEHTLVRDGGAHSSQRKLIGVAPGYVGRLPWGCALCSCGWLSEPLPTTEARRQAHAQHVTEEQS